MYPVVHQGNRLKTKLIEIKALYSLQESEIKKCKRAIEKFQLERQ